MVDRTSVIPKMSPSYFPEYIGMHGKGEAQIALRLEIT
jgi:hypothetical protein